MDALPILAMAGAGLALHFLLSWSEFRRAKDTPTVGPIDYLRHDPVAWMTSALCSVVSPFLVPEVADYLDRELTLTPGMAFLFSYVASSMGPKLLGSFIARYGNR